MSDSFLPLTPSVPAILAKPSAMPRPLPDRLSEGGARDPSTWAAAQAMETAFLAEMLGEAGLGAVSGAFGGGIGEEQFSSFLRQEQASALVHVGGIGLSEQIYNALVKREAS